MNCVNDIHQFIWSPANDPGFHTSQYPPSGIYCSCGAFVTGLDGQPLPVSALPGNKVVDGHCPWCGHPWDDHGLASVPCLNRLR